jgi:sigma-E factor negative regulatory protein RseB
VVVNPRDAYRYGYRLWIDEKTAMPLKSQLCDGSGRVIEQIVFASLTLSPQIPEAAFRPEVSTTGFRWLRQEPAEGGRAAMLPASAGAPAIWNAVALPPGFRMTKRSEQTLPGALGSVAHLVFSDGVASVSVFVENTRGPQDAAALAGAMQLGSSAAFSTRVDGHLVTAVGEVPANTVRLIASQVRPTTPLVTPPTLRAEQSVPAEPAGSPLRRSPADARPGQEPPEPFGKRQSAPAFAPQGPQR